MKLQTFLTFLCTINTCISSISSLQILWDNNANIDLNSIDVSRLDVVKLPNWFFIFPGTKWCGAGNIASDTNDFGEFRDTDKCCRNHDLCPDVIEGYQDGHNLTNPNFFTRLNCECDEEFYNCLKTVNGPVATQVGHIYFSGIGTQCFKEDYPIISCLEYTYIPRKKCQTYQLDQTKGKIYQWFDVPNF